MKAQVILDYNDFTVPRKSRTILTPWYANREAEAYPRQQLASHSKRKLADHKLEETEG